MTSRPISAEQTEPRAAERKRRRGAAARFAIAGLAVVGIGGALTAAAWVVNAEITAPVSVADFELQGAVGAEPTGEAGWTTSDGSGELLLQIPAGHFADLHPAAGVVEVPVWLRNNGSANMLLGVAEPGAIWEGHSSLTVDVDLDEFVLAPDTHQRIVISFDPAGIPVELQGNDAGVVRVVVTGVPTAEPATHPAA